jgi:hypothetical protein
VLGTDKAADAFKEFRVRIQDGSTLTKESLESIGLSSEEIATKMADGSMTAAEAFQLVTDKLRETNDQNVVMQSGVGLLGTQFEDLGTKGALGLSMVGTEFENVAGKTEALDVQYSSLGEVFEGLKRKAITDFLMPLGDAMLAVVNGSLPAMQAAFDAIGGWIDEFGPKIRDGLVATWDAIAPAVQAVADAVLPVLESIGARIGEFASVIIPELIATFEAIRPPVEAVLNAITALWDAHGAEIQAIASAAWEFISSTIGNLVDIIQNVIALALNIIQGDWSGAWDNIKAIGAAAWDQIQAVVQLGADAIPAIVRLALGVLGSVVEAAWQAAKQATSDAWEAMKAAVEAGIAGAVALVRSLPEQLSGAIGNLLGLLRSAGSDLIQGLINGMNDKIEEAKQIASNAASAVANAVKGVLGIGSPSKVFYQIGKDTITGMVNGIKAGIPVVVAAVNAVGEAADNAMRQWMTGGVLNQMFGPGVGAPGKAHEQVPGQPPGVTWAMLAYAQAMAAAGAPGKMSAGQSVYDRAAERQGVFGQGTSFRFAGGESIQMAGYVGGPQPAINLNFNGPVVGGKQGMQELAGILNAQLGNMGAG